MTAGELAIVVATVLCALGFAALVVVLVSVLRALRELRTTVESLHRDTTPLLIELRSSVVVGTPTAKPVTEVHRRFELRDDGQVIRYDLSMAAMGQPLPHRLRAELRRV